jgi:hypothetical protein
MKKGLLIAATLLGACAPKPQNQDRSADKSHAVSSVSDSLKPIAKVLANNTPAWMNIPSVTGTGEGQQNGKPAILIFVDSLTDSLKSLLPANVDGYPVVVKESGTIKAR